MKIFNVTFNDGGWHSGPLPTYQVVEETEEKAKIKILEMYPHYKKGYDVWVSEFKIDGYIIEVYDEKTYSRDKIIKEILK